MFCGFRKLEKRSVIFLMSPVRLSTPRRISISATLNSIDNPMRGGMTTPKRIIRHPTTKIVSVWPSPQKVPIKAA